MKNIVETTLRLNLDKEADSKAWELLQNRDKNRYKSYSSTVVIALNDYFDRQKKLAFDPYLETREKEDAFLKSVMTTIENGLEKASTFVSLGSLLQGLVKSQEKAAPTNSDDEADTALDFANSF